MPKEVVHQAIRLFPADTQVQKVRPRNTVWDACVKALGYSPKTASERKAWGQKIKSLEEAEATEETILFVAEMYHKEWPGVDLTIHALEKWYSHFLRKFEDKKRKKAALCPECKTGGGTHTSDCSKAKAARTVLEAPAGVPAEVLAFVEKARNGRAQK